MPVISRRISDFEKRAIAFVIYSAVAVALLLLLAQLAGGPADRRDGPPALFLLGFLFVAGFLGRLWKSKMNALADEVVDEGDSLRIRKGSQEIRIPFSAITGVVNETNSFRIRLTLNADTQFGRNVLFVSRSVGPGAPAAAVAELKRRSDEARRNGRPLPPHPVAP